MRRMVRLLLLGLIVYFVVTSLNLLWRSARLRTSPTAKNSNRRVPENISEKSHTPQISTSPATGVSSSSQDYFSKDASSENMSVFTALPNKSAPAWRANTNISGERAAAKGSKRLKYILYWNEFYGSDVFRWESGQQPFIDNGCEVNTCFGTNDRKLLPIQDYDAIMFHVQTVSFFDWPKSRSPHQSYVFVTLESAQYKAIPLQFYRGLFNLTLTYRRDSDFPYLYGKFVPIPKTPSTAPVLPAPASTRTRNYAAGKDRLVAWFVSHCESRSRREKYVSLLQRYIPVDIYGDCGTLKCARSSNNSCHTTLLDKHYKFYLAFENSLCNDYVTEKLFDTLQHDVVPVVFGAVDYDKFAPPNSYIDATRFSPKELAEYLLKLNASDVLYNQYYQWKGKYWLVEADVYRRSSFCDLCKYLHSNQTKVYDDINKWWTKYQCKTWKLKQP